MSDSESIRSLEILDRRRKMKPVSAASKPARKILASAKAFLAENAFEDAAGPLAEALKVTPQEGQAYAYLAAVYREMAQRLLDHAVALDPQIETASPAPTPSPGPAGQETPPPETPIAARRPADRPNPARPPIWPNREIIWRDTDRVFRRYILAEIAPRPGLLAADRLIVTMGSCFAENIGKALSAQGLAVRHHRFREELNSTFANERMIRWAVEGPLGEDGAALEARFGAEARIALREELRTCGVYIFSMGVAPVLFDDDGRYVLWLGHEDGQASPHARFVSRTTTPRENADNVRSIIATLRALNPDVQVFLTLSPVPLAATFERRSAVLADCVSKSSLRLAIEEVMADGTDGVAYWPSFEMAKWWAAHLPEGAAFGDDGESRHVSRWMVDRIVGLFIEYFGEAPADA